MNLLAHFAKMIAYKLLDCISVVFVIGRVLQHDEREFFFWRNHDLIDGGPNFDESDVLLGMQRLNGVGGFVHELGDETTVVDGVVLLHGALNGDALLVDDNDAKDTHVRVDPIQRFFHFLRRCHTPLC